MIAPRWRSEMRKDQTPSSGVEVSERRIQLSCSVAAFALHPEQSNTAVETRRYLSGRAARAR